MDNHIINLLSQWGETGEVVVFLHYFGGAAASWQWVTTHLQSDTQCIALNLLGFGGTPTIHKLSVHHYACAVQAQLAHLQIKSYHLVGHSMGGKIALQMAANQAPGLQQLILIAPSPPTYEPMSDEEKTRLLDNHPSRDNAEKTLNNSAICNLSPAQQELAIQTHMAVSSSAWNWWLRSGMNENIAAQMHQIDVPVTAILSKDDPVIPYETVKFELSSLIPQTQIVTTSKVGHLLPFEAPDLIATQIRDAIAPYQKNYNRRSAA